MFNMAVIFTLKSIHEYNQHYLKYYFIEMKKYNKKFIFKFDYVLHFWRKINKLFEIVFIMAFYFSSKIHHYCNIIAVTRTIILQKICHTTVKDNMQEQTQYG